MGWAVAALLLLSGSSQEAGDSLLPSHSIDVLAATVVSREPSSFDLVDFREEQRERTQARPDVESRSMFGLKRHVGVAAGYDNENLHASVGFYLTVAEWGRWNFGVPSFEIGVGRYPAYDRVSNRAFLQDQMAFFVSLASAHFRAGHVQAWGLNWYVNLEQVFDMKANRSGSQFGISFSKK